MIYGNSKLDWFLDHRWINLGQGRWPIDYLLSCVLVFWIYIFIIVSGWSWLRLVICYDLLWQVLLPLNKDNKHWLLGEIDLKARHLNLYDPKKWGYTPDYHVNYYGARVCEMLPYLLRSVRLFEVRKDISNSLEPFTVSLADCPQQKTE